MKFFTGFAFLIITIYACKSGSGFGSRTLHEKYAAKLKEADLEKTALGRQWFEWSDKALSAPVMVSLPYSENGYFEAAQPRASGLRFAGKRGQKIFFLLTKIPGAGFTLFMDCWLIEGDGRKAVFSADSLQTKFEYEVEEDAEYLLRLQPELLQGGEYNLSISTGPSLAFPVSGNKAKIGSIWGDVRDAGARSHQGIDIFAPKGTPVVAAADGIVRSVTTNKLGGNVIFMRPKKRNYSLYYAHLDKQLVSSGQQVRKGDTLGLVGNTGNARTTPPHLHFGIYSRGGAIDPFVFVNPTLQKPAKPALKPTEIGNDYRLRAKTELVTNGGASVVQYPAFTMVYGFRASATHLIGTLPDGSTTAIPLQKLERATPLKNVSITTSFQLLDLPFKGSAAKTTLSSRTNIQVRGYFRDFALVRFENYTGWIPISELE